MHATHPNLEVRFPFREHGLDKAAVLDLLESSGLGLPKYYRWRSRSGCTFCFYQQKIEWVRLKREHPEAFEEAKQYEKAALKHGSPFTWSDRESLAELERPERIAQIEADYELRLAREKARRRMREMIDRARLIVLVSHDLPALEELCDRLVWLERGRIRDVGKPAEIVRAYARHKEREPLAALSP